MTALGTTTATSGEQPLKTKKIDYKNFIIVYIGCIVLVLVVVYLVYYYNRSTPNQISADEAVKTGAALLVVLASVMTVIASFRTANKQIEAANDNLTIQQSNLEKLEKTKGEITKKVEALKSYYSGKMKAYENLNLAASQFYYTLSYLQFGDFNDDLVKDAEIEIKKNTAYLYYISEDQQKLWYKFVQCGMTIIREVRLLDSEKSEPLTSTGNKSVAEENILDQFLAALKNIAEKNDKSNISKESVATILESRKQIWVKNDSGVNFGKAYNAFLTASKNEVDNLNSTEDNQS